MSDVIVDATGYLDVNFLGQYISGLYQYLIGFATLIAIVFVMIGGVRYVLAAGSPGQVGEAKKQITNAVTGLVLLMFVYVILFTVNPQLTIFKTLSIATIPEIPWEYTSGDEGVMTGGTILSNPECKAILDAAMNNGKCYLTEGWLPPTGTVPSCNYHFKDKTPAGFSAARSADFGPGWDTPIKAPFSGSVSYKSRTSGNANPCGNTINLSNGKTSITICHAKDFTDEMGNYLGDRFVNQGDIVGHMGGNCCAGSAEIYPRSKEEGWCNKAGPTCTDPEKRESCNCQSPEQSGNTSGPHVHVSWNSSDDMLNCIGNAASAPASGVPPTIDCTKPENLGRSCSQSDSRKVCFADNTCNLWIEDCSESGAGGKYCDFNDKAKKCNASSGQCE